jgi:hypothetical protein
MCDFNSIDTSIDRYGTKGVIKICKAKDKQHNGQKKKDKMTSIDLQNIHMKLKIEWYEPY